MAKQPCKHCGVEVGLLKRTKLADGNYVCRKCEALTHPLFEPLGERTTTQLEEHLKQLERGKILYEKLFVPRQKTADKTKKLKKLWNGIFVAEDIGLIAFVSKRGQVLFWGGTPFYMVFRVADLYRYDYTSERHYAQSGKEQKKYYSQFAFWETAGCDKFRVPVLVESQSINIIRYFDRAFGLKRDFNHMVNSIKTDLKSAAKNLTSIFTGKTDNQEQEIPANQLSPEAFLERYGDRTEWSAKADAALKEALPPSPPDAPHPTAAS